MQNLLKIFVFPVLFLSFLFNPAQAEVSAGFGPEHFLWREFNTNGSQALEESGFRYTLRLHLEQNRNHGFLLGYDGKLYLGTVTYSGQTLFPPYQPVITDTAYFGFQNEAVLLFRRPLSSPFILDWVTAVGWDNWRRNISPKASNQIEDYNILFIRIGPLLSPRGEKGFSIGGGVKLPFFTYENAYINALGFDQNPILSPGKQISLYLNAGYRLNSRWEGRVYYDSYHFSESPREKVTQSGVPAGVVFQPESFMDLIGLQAIYHFP